MTEGMTGYAESATAGLEGGYGGKINPDYGNFQYNDHYKGYIELTSPKLHEVSKKIRQVFEDYEDGKFGGGYDELGNYHAENFPVATELAIAALKQILAEY